MDAYVYPARLDWVQILKDLDEKGISGYRVAQLMGLEWSTVQRWIKDRYEPKHSYGAALLELHSRYCGAELTRKRQSEAIIKE